MPTPQSNLKYFRKQLKLTQFEVLAKIEAVTGKQYRQATISSWETGKTVPDMEVLHVLASIYKVKVDDLYDYGTVVNESNAPYNTFPSEKALISQLNHIMENYEKGDKDVAFKDLTQFSKNLITEMSRMQTRYEDLKEKLKAAQDVLKF